MSFKPVGEAAQDKCLHSWGGDHLRAHPRMPHLCLLLDKGHLGVHQCAACEEEELTAAAAPRDPGTGPLL